MKILQKYALPIIIVILIALAIFLNYRNDKKNLSYSTPLTFNENTAVEVFGKEDSYIKHLCYLYEEPSEFLSIDKIQYNREYIDMTIVDGGTVSGIHNIVPAGIDANHATFVGATDGEYINTIATANAEGETWQEQRVYKRADNRIYVGYQENPEPQVQNELGVFMYQGDVKNLKFNTNKFYLSLVDCDELYKKVNPQEVFNDTENREDKINF